MNSFFVVFSYLRLVLNASLLIDVFLQNSSLREYILIPPWHSATLTSTGSVGGYFPTILLQISLNIIFFFGYSRCSLLFPPPTFVFPLPYQLFLVVQCFVGVLLLVLFFDDDEYAFIFNSF